MPSSRPIRGRKGASLTWSQREAIVGFLFISPAVLGLLIFALGPILASVALSFTQWSGFGEIRRVGMQNFVQLFTQDPRFLRSLRVTVTFVLVAVPLQQAVALVFALLLNQRVRLVAIYRTILYLPNMVSGVALAVLWIWIFQPQFGILNSGLRLLLGIEGPAWLQSRTWALPALIIMSCWTVGSPMIICLAGLQDVPQHLYEAAEIDGAGLWSKFRTVTLPMISPVVFFNLIMGLIGGFQVFTQGYVMTGGGPQDATLFYNLYLYQSAFQYNKMGYASAMAWVLFAIILAVTLVQFRVSQSWVYYEGGKA